MKHIVITYGVGTHINMEWNRLRQPHEIQVETTICNPSITIKTEKFIPRRSVKWFQDTRSSYKKKNNNNNSHKRRLQLSVTSVRLCYEEEYKLTQSIT